MQDSSRLRVFKIYFALVTVMFMWPSGFSVVWSLAVTKGLVTSGHKYTRKSFIHPGCAMLQHLQQSQPNHLLWVESFHVEGHTLGKLMHDAQCWKGIHSGVQKVDVAIAPCLEVIPRVGKRLAGIHTRGPISRTSKQWMNQLFKDWMTEWMTHDKKNSASALDSGGISEYLGIRIIKIKQRSQASKRHTSSTRESSWALAQMAATFWRHRISQKRSSRRLHRSWGCVCLRCVKFVEWSHVKFVSSQFKSASCLSPCQNYCHCYFYFESLPYPHLTPHINETMRQWLNMRDTDTSPVALKLPFHLQIMRMLCMI